MISMQSRPISAQATQLTDEHPDPHTAAVLRGIDCAEWRPLSLHIVNGTRLGLCLRRHGIDQPSSATQPSVRLCHYAYRPLPLCVRTYDLLSAVCLEARLLCSQYRPYTARRQDRVAAERSVSGKERNCTFVHTIVPRPRAVEQPSHLMQVTSRDESFACYSLHRCSFGPRQ